MDLRPSIIDDLGILATLRWFTREFQAVYNHIKVDVDSDVDEEDIQDPLKVVLFRIVQEALNNVARHSRADSASVSLGAGNGNIELTIEDNGVGFSAPSRSHTRPPLRSKSPGRKGSCRARTT